MKEEDFKKLCEELGGVVEEGEHGALKCVFKEMKQGDETR